MRDIWNPWHGCRKISEGCRNCYMFYLDAQRGRNGGDIYRVGSSFDYPVQKNRSGSYKVPTGSFVRVCLTSDFFLEEADAWRAESWDIIRERSDVVFVIVTKRVARIAQCLPADWGDGWENVWINATCETQKMADERIPVLLELPLKHKGIMVEPFLERISLMKYLVTGELRNVWAGGENYEGARPLRLDWVKSLSEECRKSDTTFEFFDAGSVFVADGKTSYFRKKSERIRAAEQTGLSYKSMKEKTFKLEEKKSPQGDLFGGDD